MRTRNPPPHTQKDRGRERDGEKGRGTNKVCVWMRAIELKIVSERERERAGVRERGRSRFMNQRPI